MKQRKHTHGCGTTGAATCASCVVTCGCWCHKVTKKTIQARAQVLLEAWLRGMNQGGHTTTPKEIAEVYQTMLGQAKREFETMPRSNREGM